MHRLLVGSGLAALLLLPVAVLVMCNWLITPYQKYVISSDDHLQVKVGLVLGAGVAKNGKPFKELEARLDSAATALQAGQVQRLLVSGDNRFDDYNEPQAMKDYLVEVKHIPANLIQPDYAGRSTYESCERAAKIFDLKQTIIFSAGSHLPRAIFLCRHFGIQAYGISSGVEANNSGRREPLARVKAIYNVYVNGEPTVFGPKISLE
jgi:SanA protein